MPFFEAQYTGSTWLQQCWVPCFFEVANRVASELGCEVGGRLFPAFMVWFDISVRQPHGFYHHSPGNIGRVEKRACFLNLESQLDSIRFGRFSCPLLQQDITGDQDQVNPAWFRILIVPDVGSGRSSHSKIPKKRRYMTDGMLVRESATGGTACQ